MDKIKEICQKYGINIYNKNGTEKNIYEFLDDIYLLLSPKELEQMLKEIYKFADIIWANRIEEK